MKPKMHGTPKRKPNMKIEPIKWRGLLIKQCIGLMHEASMRSTNEDGIRAALEVQEGEDGKLLYRAKLSYGGSTPYMTFVWSDPIVALEKARAKLLEMAEVMRDPPEQATSEIDGVYVVSSGSWSRPPQ